MKPNKSKFNYKILDKKTGKFFTTGRSKSTWQQKGAVIDFIKNKTTRQLNGGYYNARSYAEPEYKIDEIEVYIYPLDNATIMNASDFISENQAQIDLLKAKKQQKENKRKAESLVYELKRLEEQQKETEKRLNDVRLKIGTQKSI